MRLRIARRGGVLALAAAAALLAGAAPASAAPGDGSAYGVNVNVTLLGTPAVVVGPLAAASTAGPTTNTLATVNIPGIVTAGVINTSAMLNSSTGAVTSEASTADVALPLLSAFGTVGAKLVDAKCSATQGGITGTTTLAGVNLGTIGTVSATPAPNTVLIAALPIVGNVASITFNEQIHNTDGSLTVNAIHVRLLGGGAIGTIGSGDIIISSATCGPAALPIPMASGAGLWIGVGLLGAIAIPTGAFVLRRRRTNATAA